MVGAAEEEIMVNAEDAATEDIHDSYEQDFPKRYKSFNIMGTVTVVVLPFCGKGQNAAGVRGG